MAKASDTSASKETTKSSKKTVPEMKSATTETPKKRVIRKKAAAKAEVTSGEEAPVKKTKWRLPADHAEAGPPPPVMKAFWGVFNPMMVQVAQYDYANEKEAQKAAEEMTEKKKTPHFVQVIKKLV
ncbi:MAG: hypothetical protein FWC50_05600 [Planctomycetaceae bacterium]|nr:hypothetical protein [Planctomycetaceae bacterium]